MNIYIDFDDCLCETARNFCGLVKKLYGTDVPYEKIKYFNLKKSYSLTDEQYERLMIEGHKPEVLLSYEEAPGASDTVRSWIAAGHDVRIITGRPAGAYEPSRAWLDAHGLNQVKLYCLNKYGRAGFSSEKDYCLEIEDYLKMHFDYAVEDSPAAFQFFGHLPDLQVLVYDRPWNRACEFPSGNFRRCADWETIDRIVRDSSNDKQK